MDKKLEEQKKLFEEFNKASIESLDEVNKWHGKTFPNIAFVLNMAKMLSTNDISKLGKLAWPIMNEHRAKILKKDSELFIKYDIMNLKQFASVNCEVMWKNMTPAQIEKLWEQSQEMLDILDDLNTLGAFEVEVVKEEMKEQKKKVLSNLQNDLQNITSSSPKEKEKNDPKTTTTNDNKELDPKTKNLAKKLIGGFGEMIGAKDDPEIKENIESFLHEIDHDSLGSQSNPNALTSIQKIFNVVTSKLDPTTDDNSDDMNLTEKQKQEKNIHNKLEKIRHHSKVNHMSKLFFGLDATTNDPQLKAEIKAVEDAEKERMQNPSASKEFSIVAHFNYKFMRILEKLNRNRGLLAKLKKHQYKQISALYEEAREKFSENPSTWYFIDPISEWFVKHRVRILKQNPTLFLNTKHPFCLKFEITKIWKSLSKVSQDNFWIMIKHPMQLATIHYHLKHGDMEEIRMIVDDLLHASNIACDSQRKETNQKKLISDSLWGAMNGQKFLALKKLFDRMQNESNSTIINSIVVLIEQLLPVLLGSESTSGDETAMKEDSDDDDPNYKSKSTENKENKENKDKSVGTTTDAESTDEKKEKMAKMIGNLMKGFKM